MRPRCACRIAGVPQDIAVDRAFLARVCSAVPADETPAILRADGGFVLRLPENGDLWWMGVDILTDGVSSASLSEGRTEMPGNRVGVRAPVAPRCGLRAALLSPLRGRSWEFERRATRRRGI